MGHQVFCDKKRPPCMLSLQPTHQYNQASLWCGLCQCSYKRSIVNGGTECVYRDWKKYNTQLNMHDEAKIACMCPLSCHMKIAIFSHKTLFLCTFTELSLLLLSPRLFLLTHTNTLHLIPQKNSTSLTYESTANGNIYIRKPESHR